MSVEVVIFVLAQVVNLFIWCRDALLVVLAHTHVPQQKIMLHIKDCKHLIWKLSLKDKISTDEKK